MRGILIGCVLCAIIAIGAPYGRQLIKGTASADSATPAAFFLFFTLLLILHLALAGAAAVGVCAAANSLPYLS